jgi:hypothetical protein
VQCGFEIAIGPPVIAKYVVSADVNINLSQASKARYISDLHGGSEARSFWLISMSGRAHGMIACNVMNKFVLCVFPLLYKTLSLLMLLRSLSDHIPILQAYMRLRMKTAEHSAAYVISFEMLQRRNAKLQHERLCIDNNSMMSSTPFQHVTQVDDKCGRDRLHMCPLALCVNLQPRVVICCEDSQHSIVCVRTSAIHALQW